MNRPYLVNFRHSDAGCEVIFSPIDESRYICFACFDHIRTARMKPATDRRIHRRRRITRKDYTLALALAPRVDNRHRADERLSVWVQRLLQNRACLAKVDDLSEIPDRNPVGDVVHERELG